MTTNVEGRCYFYWQVGKVLDQLSLFAFLIDSWGSWKAPSINVLQTIRFQIIWHHRLILKSKLPCSFAAYKEGSYLSIRARVKLSDDDTQSPGVSANTNPEANQTVPHNPLLQAGYRERRGGGEGSMKVWTGWRRDTPAPWRSLRQLIFSLTVIVPVKITAKIHSQSGTG